MKFLSKSESLQRTPGRDAWRVALWCVGACASVAACGGSGSSGVAADVIYTNGKIVTVDSGASVAQAMAIKDGKFLRVGTANEALEHRGANTAVVDLKGQTVVPGLTDSHFHATGGGPGFDISKVRSLAELFAAVTAAAKRAAPGEVVISNADWHEAQLAEQRLPTAVELEKAAPGVPVILVRGGHSIFLNTTAINQFKITKDTPVPVGGAIGKDASGELTGELDDNARALAPLPATPPITNDGLLAEMKTLNGYGLTGVTYPGSTPTVYKQLQQLRDAKKSSVRYSVMMRATDAAGFAALAAAGIQPRTGDEWTKVWGVKMLVDGGFEGGLMSQAYLDPLGKGGTYFGTAVVPQAAFTAQVMAASAAGWRVSTHAVGDAGVDMVLKAYETAHGAKDIAKDGWTIEHAFVTRPDQYPRMKALNLRLSVQDHLYLVAPTLRGYWGIDRASQVTPVKTYKDQGFLMASGTDSPVIPLNPFWVMYHFLSRDTISAGIFGANQAITDRQEVLRMSTLNHYKFSEQDDILGSIEKGKIADFVILSADYLTIPVKQIESLKAMATFVGGQLVYKDPGFSL